MELERVNPPSLPPPSGFSHAVVATGGRLVFLAGQIAHGADGAIVGDTVVAQFERALANVLELRDDRVADDRAVGAVGDLARQEDQPPAGGHHRVREAGGPGQ